MGSRDPGWIPAEACPLDPRFRGDDKGAGMTV
jgi:hypothetical protein